MAISHNPTRTRRIEKAWLRDINRRWGEFTKNTMTRLRAMNAGESPLLFNANDPFRMNPEQIAAFMAFYQSEIDRLLLGSDNAPNWQAQYQIEAYTKGIERGRASLRAQGLSDQLTQADVIAGQSFRPGDFTATPSLVSGGAAIAAPIHQETIEFLTARSFDTLEGWTTKMARETQNILADGVRQGLGIDEVTKSITARINVSKSDAARIARTETIQGYQRAKINNAVEAEQQFGEPVVMRWITARDGRVRDLHAQWHGQLMSPQDAQINIGVSPYNCRCSLVEVIPEANTPERQKVFDDERKKLLNEEKERREREREKRAQKIVDQATAGDKPRPQGFFDASKETREYVNSSFNDPKYKSLVASVPTPSAIPKENDGAYWMGNGIHMDGYKPNQRAAQSVYRHEFGHHVDFNRGEISKTKAFNDLRLKDAEHIDQMVKPYMANAIKRGVTDDDSRMGWQFATASDTWDLEAEFKASNMTLKEFTESNVKPGGFVERMLPFFDWDKIAKAQRQENRVLRFVAADKYDNMAALVDSMYYEREIVFVDDWREGSMIADLVGSLTDLMYGGGHSQSYYDKFVIGDIRYGNNTEAFAQLFALNDNAAGDLAADMAQFYAPNTNGYFLRMLNDDGQ